MHDPDFSFLGVPKLKRSELEVACEDFSNVIGGSSIGTVYKGILSNGCEIAVVSVAATSVKNWSNNLEARFRNKVYYNGMLSCCVVHAHSVL